MQTEPASKYHCAKFPNANAAKHRLSSQMRHAMRFLPHGGVRMYVCVKLSMRLISNTFM